jgi:5-methylthioadenosine/S-adenosylhomocysteine deaminase
MRLASAARPASLGSRLYAQEKRFSPALQCARHGERKMNVLAESGAPVDLLIHNAMVVTVNDRDEIFSPGAVAIRGDSILWVGPEEFWSSAVEPGERLDARGGLVMPGLINAHTHAAMTCFRGLADDLPLSVWLNEHIFPAEKKINAGLVYWGTLLACAEMILGGTTTFCDMYLFEGEVAKAAHEAGMRALVGEVLYDFPSPNYGPPEQGLAYTRDLIHTWAGDPLISVAIEPHSSYTCSPELLRGCNDIAVKHKVPMIIHLSESEDEVRQVRERYGSTPVGHLERLGLLGPHVIADHCVVLSEEDKGLIAGRGVRVAHNPESNMKLANGVAPVPDLLALGVPVGLGTDGCASNNNLDMFAEMDTVAKLHKVHRLDPTVMDARTVVRMATRGSARVLGLENRVGSLEPGKKADLVCLDLTLSIINGRVVMRDREVLTLDVERVMAEVRKIAHTIKGG